jgi:signal transduction histidine kinase
VLANLAGNAVKFTPSGGHVSLTADAVGDAVDVCVSDTGPGIPCAEIDTVVEPFVQLHTGAKRGGWGLGLFIARGLTQLMGGELLVRSTIGVGTRFTVRLAAATSAAAARRRAPATRVA